MINNCIVVQLRDWQEPGQATSYFLQHVCSGLIKKERWEKTPEQKNHHVVEGEHILETLIEIERVNSGQDKEEIDWVSPSKAQTCEVPSN